MLAGNTTLSSTMGIQNISIEGANDEAIEDAATRIYEAIRPQPLNAENNLSYAIISYHDKNIIVASAPPDSSDDNSDESSTFDGGNSTASSSSCDNNDTEYEDVESNILYLEEKKRILRKAKIHMEKEKAYITMNAHHIANGRELPFRRSRSPSIWSEAKAMIQKFQLDGTRSDPEEASSSDMVSSAVSDSEARGSTSSQSPSNLQPLSTVSSSKPDTRVNTTSRTRKRRKIDISNVKHISSAVYAEECAGNEVETTTTEDRNDQNYVLPTTRFQQVREMHLSMDSRKWISQAVLKQIFSFSHAAISEHRRSLIRAGKGE